ncbi:hypothetical protein [Anaeromyxobacter sp. Fw109-5]|uniref:hypothetical protein n=1 Tax=Anaeromyxobacter sp. (strain Fw109-5) TaxID=404589 RepID=UPI00059C9E15|nr:hypothetical protein [Anaeromyxobacter sp. Fw109-5]
MDDPRHALPATPRREFLRLMALAPALAAGCAGARASAPAPTGSSPAGPPGATSAPGASDPLEPLRSFKLALDAEPAFVFRAHPARPGA